MSDVLNRTTNLLLTSVNTPDYPGVDWVINPDLSNVSGFSSIYWIISGDIVTLMNQTERDEVDLVIANALISAEKESAKVEITARTLKAFAKVIMNEINILRSNHGLNDRTLTQLVSAMEGEIDNG